MRDVVILVDNDHSGTGQNAAKTLAVRLAARGIKVRIALPPPPDPGKKSRDFSDVLLRDGPDAVRDLIESAEEYQTTSNELEDAANPLPKGARWGVEPYYAATPLDAEEVSDRLGDNVLGNPPTALGSPAIA